VAGTYLLARASGQYSGPFYDYVTIGVTCSAGAFLLLPILISDTPLLCSDQPIVSLAGGRLVQRLPGACW
jgi:hypothetical protein